jgi:hypothetical protein
MHAKVEARPQMSDDEQGSTGQAADGHESTRPIRALNRGLDVLTELNRLERAAINTLSNAVQLPRTTTYRILETLRLAGYVERDPHDDPPSWCARSPTASTTRPWWPTLPNPI